MDSTLKRKNAHRELNYFLYELTPNEMGGKNGKKMLPVKAYPFIFRPSLYIYYMISSICLFSFPFTVPNRLC